MEENIVATVGGLDEAEALSSLNILILPLGMLPSRVFHDFDLDPTVERSASAKIFSAEIVQRANTRPATAIATSAMIASSNSFSAIE